MVADAGQSRRLQSSCGSASCACRTCKSNDVIGNGRPGNISYPPCSTWTIRWETRTCVACGDCVQACPEGALMPATGLNAGSGPATRADFDSGSHFGCPFGPGVGCQFAESPRKGKVKYVRGITARQTKGRSASRGRFGFDYTNSPPQSVLTKPLTAANDAPAKG